MDPVFRASSQTRLTALRVRLTLLSYQDPARAASLLQRVESLGRRTGAKGLVRIARQLWDAVRSPSVSA